MKESPPPLEAWLSEIKAETGGDGVGIFLMHNGIVRATSKADGCAVAAMEIDL